MNVRSGMQEEGSSSRDLQGMYEGGMVSRPTHRTCLLRRSQGNSCKRMQVTTSRTGPAALDGTGWDVSAKSVEDVMSALTDYVIHESERITFATAVKICEDLAEIYPEPVRGGCLVCAREIKAIADARIEQIVGLR